MCCKPEARSWIGFSTMVLATPLCSCCALCHWTLPTRPTTHDPDLLNVPRRSRVRMFCNIKMTDCILYNCCIALWMFLSPVFPLYCPLASHVCVAISDVRFSEQWSLWLRINRWTLAYHLSCIIVKCDYIKLTTLTFSTFVGSDLSRRDGEVSGLFTTRLHRPQEELPF